MLQNDITNTKALIRRSGGP